jgi:hypothetical protein
MKTVQFTDSFKNRFDLELGQERPILYCKNTDSFWILRLEPAPQNCYVFTPLLGSGNDIQVSLIWGREKWTAIVREVIPTLVGQWEYVPR